MFITCEWVGGECGHWEIYEKESSYCLAMIVNSPKYLDPCVTIHQKPNLIV